MHPIRFVKQKILMGLNDMVSDVGPLSFFSQWFNPNNMVGELEQMEQFKGVVYVCVTTIAREVGKMQLTLNKTRADGTMVPIAKDHSFLQLLKHPNPEQSTFEFFEMTDIHMDLAGEAFWYIPKGSITGKPKELWLMRPDLVQIAYDAEDGEVSGYVYHKWNGRVQVPLDLDEVIHIKLPNPINPYRGMSPVQAGIVYIQTEDYASQFSRNFLANGGAPSGIVNFKGTIPDPEFQKVKRQWQREYGGVENGGKTAFLRNVDATYTKVGSSLSDIDLKDLKNLTRDDIMMMYGISRTNIGIQEDVPYANAKTARFTFMSNTVDPRMFRLTNVLQRFYDARYNDGYLVSYTSPIPQDNDEKLAYLTAAVGGPGRPWMTPNEARSIENMAPVAGGDTLLVPFNIVPLTEAEEPGNKSTDTGSAPPDTGEDLENDDQAPDSSDSDNNPDDDGGNGGSGDAGNGDNQDADTGMGDGSDSGTKTLVKRRIIVRLKKKATAPPTLREVGKESYRLQLMKTADSYVPQLKGVVSNAIATSKQSMLHQIKTVRKRDLGDDLDYNQDQTKQAIIDQLMPILAELMVQAGRQGIDLAGMDIAYGMSAASQDRITARIDKVASAYTDELKSTLVKTIRTGLEQGQTIAQITNGIESTYSEWQGWRAERLARTEAIHEANYAALDAYSQSTVIIKKEWYANPDACEYCQAMNGQVMDLEEAFVQKGATVSGVDGGTFLADYEDVEAGDLHPNCRCTILPVVGGE